MGFGADNCHNSDDDEEGGVGWYSRIRFCDKLSINSAEISEIESGNSKNLLLLRSRDVKLCAEGKAGRIESRLLDKFME